MTLFEKLIAREIAADIVYEDDEVFAFRDLHPQAPDHVLIVPKKPLPRLAAASENDAALLGKVLLAVAHVARMLNVADNGYRVVINNGSDAGETVPHLHFHLLAGRKLTWPPG